MLPCPMMISISIWIQERRHGCISWVVEIGFGPRFLYRYASRTPALDSRKECTNPTSWDRWSFRQWLTNSGQVVSGTKRKMPFWWVLSLHSIMVHGSKQKSECWNQRLVFESDGSPFEISLFRNLCVNCQPHWSQDYGDFAMTGHRYFLVRWLAAIDLLGLLLSLYSQMHFLFLLVGRRNENPLRIAERP